VLYGNLDNVVRAVAVCNFEETLPGPKTGVQYGEGPHLLLQWEQQQVVNAYILAWLAGKPLPSLSTPRTDGHGMQGLSLTQRCGGGA
jgi:hypothetical protein